MLDWLNDSPGFPVSQNAAFQNREAANPRGYAVFPVSRFSRFENEGAAQQRDETANACEKKPAPIPEHLPELLKAVAARIGRATAEELHAQAGTNPERLAQLCRLILAAPPTPTPEDVAELDALMVRLCELEPWLSGYLQGNADGPAKHGACERSRKPDPVSGIRPRSGRPARRRVGGGGWETFRAGNR